MCPETGSGQRAIVGRRDDACGNAPLIGRMTDYPGIRPSPGGAKIWRLSRTCTALVQGDFRGGVAAAWGALCRGSDAPIWVFFPRAAHTTVCQEQVGVQDRSYISRRVLRPENSEYPQNRLDVCHLLQLKHPALSAILLSE